MNRREFLDAGMTAIALSNLAQPQSKTHDMGGMQHPMPERPEDIVMLIYLGMTALDLIGPQQVFGYVGRQCAFGC